MAIVASHNVLPREWSMPARFAYFCVTKVRLSFAQQSSESIWLPSTAMPKVRRVSRAQPETIVVESMQNARELEVPGNSGGSWLYCWPKLQLVP